MRLQSFLSRAGIASRRNVIQELEAGKIKVNGQVVRIPSYPIFPEKDKVTYQDQPITLSSQRLYFIFNKPRGTITTVKDTHGRKTVSDYFKHVKERLYPVGRLDQDTTGLLLLTNDGDLANRLMHPRYGVEKVYEAHLNRGMTKEQVEQLEKGIVIEGEKTAPCRIKVCFSSPVIPARFSEAAPLWGKRESMILDPRHFRRRTSSSSRKVLRAWARAFKHSGITSNKYEIILHEGRKRQIRNMFQAIGFKVLNLHRTRYGPLNLKDLAPGKSRLLSGEELKKLRTLGMLSH